MTSLRSVLAASLSVLPALAAAQTTANTGGLQIELNAVETVENACRLTFLVENQSDTSIDTANYQVVIFDEGGVFERLTLFGFRDLPAGRPRVRQFDVRDIACDSLGRVLFNGLSACTVGGADSTACDATPTLTTRTEVELLG